MWWAGSAGGGAIDEGFGFTTVELQRVVFHPGPYLLQAGGETGGGSRG